MSSKTSPLRHRRSRTTVMFPSLLGFVRAGLPFPHWRRASGTRSPKELFTSATPPNLALNSFLDVRARQGALGKEAGTARLPPIDYQRASNFGIVSLGPSPPAPLPGVPGREEKE